MKSVPAAIAAALLWFAPATAAAAPGNPPSWTAPYPPFRVIDNVYYVGTTGISAWLIATPKGLILIDVGMPRAARLVEGNIRALGFQPADVKILLVSHAHFDHAGGLARVKRDTHATLMAGAGDRQALETGTYVGSESRRDWDFPPVKVDHALADGEEVRLGGVVLTALATPGHTAGCTSYLMTVREAGQAHRAIFFCSASVAANRLAPDPHYPGVVADYRRTFARLKTLSPDIYLAPHAEFFDLAGKRAAMGPGKPNPFVRPGEFTAAMAEFETDFEAALARRTGGG